MTITAPTDKQSLLLFLQSWYGNPKLNNISLPQSTIAPPELLEWHEISTQWSGAIASHNYAIPLQELAAEDGIVPFWVENQGNWIWAFDPNNEGHSVYERNPSDASTDWSPTGERLSDFLIHATILEAILGAPARKVTQGVLGGFPWSSKEISTLPFPAWNWPCRGSRIILGSNWMALAHPSMIPQSGQDITLAALTQEDLVWAENKPGITWNSYTSGGTHISDEPPPW